MLTFGELILLGRDYNVVVSPEGVGPVINTIPCGTIAAAEFFNAVPRN